VWQDNISKILLLKKVSENEDSVSIEESQKNIKHDSDAMVKKLEDFLTHNERTLCEVNVKLILEGLQLNLFMDTEEVRINKIIFIQMIAIFIHIFYCFLLYYIVGIEFSCTRLESWVV